MDIKYKFQNMGRNSGDVEKLRSRRLASWSSTSADPLADELRLLPVESADGCGQRVANSNASER